MTSARIDLAVQRNPKSDYPKSGYFWQSLAACDAGDIGMKEQYVGDINDYRKYALLRILADGGRIKIGVCWMLTEGDGTTNGSKTAYLDKPERYRAADPELFDLLRSAIARQDGRRLAAIEASGAIPGAVYFNDLLPDDRVGREAFMAAQLNALRDAELVFFDPDNGLEVGSKPKGRKESSKYLYLDEVEQTYVAGKSIVLYQHFPRKERQSFITETAQKLAKNLPAARIYGVVTSDVVFMIALQPIHQSTIHQQIAAIESPRLNQLSLRTVEFPDGL
jgi:hypothetical protein